MEASRLTMSPESILEIPIRGLSMRPLLPPGSTAMVQRCSAADLRVGDIALFRSRRVLVVHRVVALQGGPDDLQLAERGDWGAKPRWRPAWQVVGRVVAVKLRHGRLDLDRPLVKRILALSGLGTSLPHAPKVVRRVAIPVIAGILILASAVSFTDPVERSSEGTRRHASDPAQADPQ